MRRHKLAILLTVLAFAGVGGAAFAATQSGGNPRQAFLNDLANRLHVSPAQLNAALKGAMLDRLAAALKSGRLTQAQANAIRQRIESGQLPLWLAGPPEANRFGPRFAPRFGPGFPPAFGLLRAAASYLGLTPQQLMQRLQSGMTPAQIASAQHKSLAGVRQAILGALRTRLNQAVAAGRISKSQAQSVLAMIERRLDLLLQRGPFPGRRTLPGAAPLYRPGGLPAPGVVQVPGAPPAPGVLPIPAAPPVPGGPPA